MDDQVLGVALVTCFGIEGTFICDDGNQSIQHTDLPFEEVLPLLGKGVAVPGLRDAFAPGAAFGRGTEAT